MAKKIYVGTPKMYTNTLLLLHGDSLSDSSIYGRTIINSGVTISTTQSKFNGKSMYFDGSSYLQVENLIKSNSTFTIDCWVYPTVNKANTVWSHGGSNTSAVTGGVVDMYTDGQAIYYCSGFLIQGGSYSLNTWHHLALIGDGASIKLYLNGTLVGTHTGSYNFSSQVETIGANDSAIGSENFQGYIDEFRISNVVRWTSNFTPPSSAYTSEIIEANNIASQVKKLYIGDSYNKARKIKKGYIGIGGVSRPFYGGGELTYYGTITDLSVARSKLSATSIGEYTLFGGGEGSEYIDTGYYNQRNIVDAYNSSLTRSAPSVMIAPVSNLASESIGEYALFAGGYRMMGNYTGAVTAYNKSLTRTSLGASLGEWRSNLASTSVGNYAIFGGGLKGSSSYSSYIDCYNTSLTKPNSTPTLSRMVAYLAATTVGDYALFGGGGSGVAVYYSNVDAYNTSLTRVTATSLSKARPNLAATHVGNYALFGGGGYPLRLYSKVVDAYDKSLTRSILAELSQSRFYLAATTIGNYAMFGGGMEDVMGNSYYANVDVYDTSLTKTMATNLSQARSNLASTSSENYAFFGGGISESSNNTTYYSTVDVYTII